MRAFWRFPATFAPHGRSLLFGLLFVLALGACRGDGGPPADDRMPTLTLLSPREGASFMVGDPFEILAEASDGMGTAARVVFQLGGEDVASLSAPPYQHSLSIPEPGSYALTATAYDAAGLSSLPARVTLEIKDAPKAVQVALLSPQPGASVPLGEALELVAEVEGEVAHVQFSVNGRAGARISAPPYRDTFTPTATGRHVVSVLAQGRAGSAVAESEIGVLEPEALVVLSSSVSGAGQLVSEPGGVSCPEVCEASFPAGEALTLRAVAAADWTFAGWGGACQGETGTTCTLTPGAGAALSVSSSFVPVALDIGVAIRPQRVSLEPGAQATFTATVANSDAGVTWSATGGTITGSGSSATYTAPGAPGSYSVSAVSAEDASKKASATVTVTAPTTDANAPFTIVALPDTQGYVCSTCSYPRWYPESFKAQVKWAVDNRATKNVVFVTHLGDIVEKGDETAEWMAANAAMSQLDGKLPYSVAIGDHDYYKAETKPYDQWHSGDTSNYVKYFGKKRYQGYRWYLGAGPREHSHAQRFDAGGYTFLHLTLEWEPLDDTLEWAQGVLRANPGLPTIISTHAYLSDGVGGCRCRPSILDNYDQTGNTGEQVFQKLVRPNPQVFMVLNGHYHGTNWRVFSSYQKGIATNDGEYHQVSANAAGLPVFEMLSNYQDYELGGDGWMRLITFMPGGGASGQDRIFVQTYSPVLEMYQTDHKGTQRASEFYFDLDFSARFAAR